MLPPATETCGSPTCSRSFAGPCYELSSRVPPTRIVALFVDGSSLLSRSPKAAAKRKLTFETRTLRHLASPNNQGSKRLSETLKSHQTVLSCQHFLQSSLPLEHNLDYAAVRRLFSDRLPSSVVYIPRHRLQDHRRWSMMSPNYFFLCVLLTHRLSSWAWMVSAVPHAGRRTLVRS